VTVGVNPRVQQATLPNAQEPLSRFGAPTGVNNGGLRLAVRLPFVVWERLAGLLGVVYGHARQLPKGRVP
jgi:hypothetical protein